MWTKPILGVAALCLSTAVAPPVLARAQPAPTDQAPVAPADWADTLKFSGQIEAGITFNPDSPSDHRNFGHLFTDHSNRLVLNQLLLTAQRPLDP